MSVADYVVLAILAVGVILSVISMVRRKKSGRCIGCSGDCSQCAYHVQNGGKNKK